MIPYTSTPEVWRISVGPLLGKDPIREHDVTIHGYGARIIFRDEMLHSFSCNFPNCSLASVFYKRRMGCEKSVVACSRVVALDRNGT
jgi:hypothetical protein